jgi:hypothetical protein
MLFAINTNNAAFIHAFTFAPRVLRKSLGKITRLGGFLIASTQLFAPTITFTNHHWFIPSSGLREGRRNRGIWHVLMKCPVWATWPPRKGTSAKKSRLRLGVIGTVTPRTVAWGIHERCILTFLTLRLINLGFHVA